MTENAYFCQVCGLRDDDWFLCHKKDCRHKRPTPVPSAPPPDDFLDRAALAALTGLLQACYPRLWTPEEREQICVQAFDLATALSSERAKRIAARQTKEPPHGQ